MSSVGGRFPGRRSALALSALCMPCAPQGLSMFGNGFLSKFEGAMCDNRLLEEISLVDTPGGRERGREGGQLAGAGLCVCVCF